jgi:hypothetical protein
MRRTHASLSRKAGIDPKLVADQLGHGLGVNLDVYTIAGLDQRLLAVNALEQRVCIDIDQLILNANRSATLIAVVDFAYHKDV